MGVGENVRRWRERLALTQGELAKRAGMTPNTVWRLETGQGRPYLSTIRKLADAMQIDVQELTEGGGSSTKAAGDDA